jgi:hypothetical protein
VSSSSNTTHRRHGQRTALPGRPVEARAWFKDSEGNLVGGRWRPRSRPSDTGAMTYSRRCRGNGSGRVTTEGSASVPRPSKAEGVLVGRRVQADVQSQPIVRFDASAVNGHAREGLGTNLS